MCKFLDVDIIKANLDAKLPGRKILVYKSTSSTNDVAVEYAKAGKINNGLAVFAERQSSGRGRRGNKWLGGDGKSLLFSVLLFDIALALEMVTLVSAVAVAQAIGEFSPVRCGIKWPNDIIVGTKKLGGILLESFSQNGKGNNYIIGVGINCCQSQADFDEEIAEIATSIKIESGQNCDRNFLAAKLINNLEKWLEAAKADPQQVLVRWQQMSRLLGRRVRLECDRKEFVGICTGIDPVEGLVLQLERGGVRLFNASHTTVIAYGNL
ncbi:MAG: biotin--[acetyl-CoA-carboxylase] ligase [Anaerohalosphaeraceae bacterium]|nr:biotin--[acetyl-CoA-carboxylase] ligase [Anaerohalosphaeraceae bacterium]